MKLHDVLLGMGDFSIDDLRKINSTVIALIKHKRNLTGAIIKGTLSTGVEVKVNHKDFQDETFKVVKVNRTKATLERKKDNVKWNIPLSIIEVI